MKEEDKVNETSASEEIVDAGSDVAIQEPPQRQVPLEALEAERKKRQDLESQNKILQDYAMRYQELQEKLNQTAEAPQEDETDLVNKRDLKQFRENLSKEDFAVMKREIAEETFKEVNPEAIKQINLHLKEILERKPWLADSINSASNRYARAYEIVQDYAPALASKKTVENEAKRIVENAKKPGSPTTVGKSAQTSNADYLRSIAGKKEFREYRQKLLQG